METEGICRPVCDRYHHHVVLALAFGLHRYHADFLARYDDCRHQGNEASGHCCQDIVDNEALYRSLEEEYIAAEEYIEEGLSLVEEYKSAVRAKKMAPEVPPLAYREKKVEL